MLVTAAALASTAARSAAADYQIFYSAALSSRTGYSMTGWNCAGTTLNNRIVSISEK